MNRLPITLSSQRAHNKPPLSQNKVLAQLPPLGLARLSRDLRYTTMNVGEILYAPLTLPDFVYFPIDGIVSWVYETANGNSAQQAIIGRDGCVGAGLAMGRVRTSSRAVVQIQGAAYRAPRQALIADFEQNGLLKQEMLYCVQNLLNQVSQTMVCNRLHSIDQQLCRWILMVSDRLDDDHFSMTHERIASILGVRRESITLAAKRLRDAGAIDNGRGKVHVLDRMLLERRVCECYGVLNETLNDFSLARELSVTYQ